MKQLLPDAPPELIETLANAGLATPEQVRSVARRAQRLAGGLPMFESVWIDALAQAGVITPYQAEQFRTGQVDGLRYGPLLITEACPAAGISEVYQALHLETGERARLEVIRHRQHPQEDAERLRQATETLRHADRRLVHLPNLIGHREDAVWGAGAQIDGATAQRWLVRRGRFEPEVVLEIARQMTVVLAMLEQSGSLHGDLNASRLMLTPSGQIVLPMPMLRPTLRGCESYASAELLPEAYDGLSPERVADGSASDVASELYACGCLWWHLAAGRSPLAGVDARGKIRAAEAARFPDIRALAPDVPPPLARAIQHCLERDPQRRPASFARLATALGAPTRRGREQLRRSAGSLDVRQAGVRPSIRLPQPGANQRLLLAAVAGIVIASGLMTWPLWKPQAVPSKSKVVAADRQEASAIGTDSVNLNPATQTNSTNPQVEPSGQRSSDEEPADAPEAIRAHGGQQAVRLLPVDRPLRLLQRLPLQTGQTVRGERDQRAQVIVPPEGLVVDREDVVFENIDFVWAPEPSMASDGPSALVRLRAAGVRFRQCSFQSSGQGPLPTAIVWQRSAEGLSSHLPTFRMELTDCVFRRLQSAVDVRLGGGAVVLECHHCLMLGPGPLVYFDQAPQADDVIQLSLTRCTLRGGSLLACRYEAEDVTPGEISLETQQCVLASGDQDALLLFAGAESPDAIIRQLHWKGEGTVVEEGCHIAAWLTGGQSRMSMDGANFSIDGLVRSKLTFAGLAVQSTAASQLERCLAPLRSAILPGISTGLPPIISSKSVENERLGS